MADEDGPSKKQRAIQHWRRLREWITDLQARRALRELIKKAEAELAEELRQEREKLERRDE